jgi:outer membrane protein assembly factor BamB
MRASRLNCFTLIVALTFIQSTPFSLLGAEKESPLSLVVMDPLAAPLSCPCVAGYAQRQYDKLAAVVGKKLGRDVIVTFAESLGKALQDPDCKRIDIVIGKDSVVRADAAKQKLRVTPIAQLTGKDGKTTQTGLIVVPTNDPAKSASDLAGYRIIYGTPECAEKFAAARALLTAANVDLPPPEEAETSAACSDGATLILELGAGVRAATVISSYAAPLLEGCGTVKKGDLRVLAETAPVPFITLFLTESMGEEEREAVGKAIVEASRTPEMLIAIESLIGFVPLTREYLEYHQPKADATKAPATAGAESAAEKSADLKTWPGWRGPWRTGHAAWLPHELPNEPEVLWQRKLTHEGLGGIAATDDLVIVGDRDFSNILDEFRAFDAATGEPRWVVRYPAMGKLDYDNSPRATPLIAADRVYLFGAFGDLHCVNLKTGLILWRKNIVREFAPEAELIWGTCSSPLLVGGKLIVNPGGEQASVVALDAKSGDVLWKTPGGEFAYASPLLATIQGVPQIVAYDRYSLGGFDPITGSRLWSLTPPEEGDFNVPSPVVVGEQLVLTSENNGTRLYEFATDGTIIEQPVATYDKLAPDMSTPVAVDSRLFCVSNKLYCLDISKGLKEIWVGEDAAFGDYAPIVASDDRLLIVGRGGEVLLIDSSADEFKVVSRFKPFGGSAGKAPSYSQPAVVGGKLYVRIGKTLACVSLAEAME